MIHYLLLAFALAACGGPSEFRLADDAPVGDAPTVDAAPVVPADVVLATDAMPDAQTALDVRADAASDTPAPDVAPSDVVVDRTVADAQNDVVDAADATDAPATDATPDAPADVTDAADVLDAGTDANGEDHRDVVSDATDSSADVAADITSSVDRDDYCARQPRAACATVRFDEFRGCRWCVGPDRCALGTSGGPERVDCAGWVW